MSRHHWDSQGFSTERVDSVRGGLIAVGEWVSWGQSRSLDGRVGGAGVCRLPEGEGESSGAAWGGGAGDGGGDQGLSWASGLAGATLAAGAGWAPHVWGVSLDKVAPPPNSNSRADPQELPPVSA